LQIDTYRIQQQLQQQQQMQQLQQLQQLEQLQQQQHQQQQQQQQQQQEQQQQEQHNQQQHLQQHQQQQQQLQRPAAAAVVVTSPPSHVGPIPPSLQQSSGSGLSNQFGRCPVFKHSAFDSQLALLRSEMVSEGRGFKIADAKC
jgi:hypothetical protein